MDVTQVDKCSTSILGGPVQATFPGLAAGLFVTNNYNMVPENPWDITPIRDCAVVVGWFKV
jgi:hypothetical protein